MLPVYDFQSVKDSMPKVRQEGAHIYGLFLFVPSNDAVMEYMADNGLIELDIMLTDVHHSTCGIFSFGAIDADWVTHARGSKNLWWRVFGTRCIATPPAHASSAQNVSHADIRQALQASPDSVIIQSNQERITRMSQLPISDWSIYMRTVYNPGVVIVVANYFGVNRSELPGVVLFANLKQRKFKWLGLSHAQTEAGVISYFSRVFSSPEFKVALEQVEQDYG